MYRPLQVTLVGQARYPTSRPRGIIIVDPKSGKDGKQSILTLSKHRSTASEARPMHSIGPLTAFHSAPALRPSPALAQQAPLPARMQSRERTRDARSCSP